MFVEGTLGGWEGKVDAGPQKERLGGGVCR